MSVDPLDNPKSQSNNTLTLWSICFKYHLLKTRWGKLDDIAYNFMLTLPHQKLYMRNLKRKKNSHKEKSTMCHMSQYHPPKTSLGKIDDMTQSCVDIGSLKILYEKLKGKTHTKKRVQYDVFNKLLIKETRYSPLETCKPFLPMY